MHAPKRNSKRMWWIPALLLLAGLFSLSLAYVNEVDALASEQLALDLEEALNEAQALPTSDTAQLLNFSQSFLQNNGDENDAFARSTSDQTYAASAAASAPWPQGTAETTLAAGVAAPTSGKWIDVNISKQRVTAYMGSQAVKTVIVSTGTRRYPTVTGSYRVYAKIPSQRMTGGSRARGDYYSLPNVPSVMYFYRGYAIHGTYWHRNFGRPMSHGCVNLTLADAKWFYDWTPMGTLVYSHY